MSIDDIATFLISRPFSQTTQEGYRRILQTFLQSIQAPEKISAQQLMDYIQRHGWGESYAWLNFITIKSFLRWRYGSSHPALLARKKRIEPGPQRSLNASQVRQLLGSFDTKTTKGLRDLAICSLMLDSGLRISEVCHLELEQVNLTERTFAVIVKGGQWSWGVFSDRTREIIARWITARAGIAMPGVAVLFVSVGGNTPGRQLTRCGLALTIRRWKDQAPSIRQLSPHDLRRTFAILSTRRGAPSRVLQVAGRWKSLAMVEHYTAAITPKDFDPYFPTDLTPKQ